MKVLQWIELAQEFSSGVLDLIFPPHCILCGQMGEEHLCSPCIKDLIQPVPPPYCNRCGQVQLGSDCTKCIDYPDGLRRCRAVGLHEGDLATLIHLLKYRDKPMLATPLGELMADFLTIRAELMNDLTFDAIIPVPLHRSRQHQRGYNQSERLSNALSRRLSIDVDTKTLTRVQKTNPQVGKNRDERLHNLTGAFDAKVNTAVGRTFLLVDDVMTTGNTINQCAKALLAAGAKEVYAITLAAG